MTTDTQIPKLVQVTAPDTLADLQYIREVLESQTGMRTSYANVINHLISQYLKERG